MFVIIIEKNTRVTEAAQINAASSVREYKRRSFFISLKKNNPININSNGERRKSHNKS